MLSSNALAQPVKFLFQTEGVLEAGDEVFAFDGSLYDIYSFDGQAGQAVLVSAESDEFDTYLSLLDNSGQVIAWNDDWNDSSNSTIGYVLPTDGTYQIRLNAYNADGFGRYQISVSKTTVDNPIIVAFKANELLQKGLEQYQLGLFHEALQTWQTALNLYREIGDRGGEGAVLGNFGIAYEALGQYQLAIGFYEQHLNIAREIKDRAGEGRALGNWGNAYLGLGQYQRAIEFYEQHLTIAREIGDRDGEGRTLGNLGVAYRNLGQYQRAIELYEKHLNIAREMGDRAGEGRALGNLGVVYDNLGQYQLAIEFYEQRLVIAREIRDRVGESRVLGSLGNTYLSLGQYQRAIDFYKQELAIAREIDYRVGEGSALGSLGVAYRKLGQYQRAIEFYEQGLAIAREISDRAGEGSALGSLGIAYTNLGQYQRAIEFYEQSLAIAREISDRAGEGRTLGNLGVIYNSLNQYQRAIEFHEQRLVIAREIGDLAGEAGFLRNLGIAYANLGQYQWATEFFEQSLTITLEIQELAEKGDILANFGLLFEIQGQPEVAIAFYKQSVNLRKQISHPLNDPVSRQSYLDTVARTYRRLENLLLEQGRQLEAQQALELFKLQELSDYANEQDLTAELPDLALLPEEAAVIDTYNDLIIANQQLRDCNTNNCSNSSELQLAKERASEQHNLATEQLVAFIQNAEYKDHPLLRDNFFLAQAKQIISQKPDTVLIYPVILDETLWLLWVTEEGVNSQQISNVNQQTLTATISAFRAGLEDRYSDLSDLQTHANQLYNWLIAPVETMVDDPSHLVLALDRNTRYIPIGALYDGQQYLVEKYDISTILAASLTNTEERTPIGTENVEVLAAGVSKQYANFSALPNVPIELDNIVKEQHNSNDQVGIYSGRQLLDPGFTAQTLRSSLSNDTRFLHIATHGEFVPGNRYSSYLLMGNGEKLPLPEIANLGAAFSGVHLAVLSACQTALGGADEEGLEIAGLGYYFFKSDVDAVMASLWNVNDSSTSQLMQAFYQVLSEGTEANPITKAEALRTAQLSLLRSNAPGSPGEDRFRRIPKNPDDQPLPKSGLAHPYYWAPFILIGNGL